MFMFKKLISSAVVPLPLIIVILFIGIFRLWFTQKQISGKFIVSLGFILLVLFSNTEIANTIIGYLEKNYEPHRVQAAQPADEEGAPLPVKYVVVLGAGQKGLPDLPVTSQVSEATMIRLVEGIRLYRQYAGSKLILSGGSGFSESSSAVLMAAIARQVGIPEEDVLVEADSLDTKDEALLVKPMVGADPFLLVTSAAHMKRSMALFQKAGMNPLAAPVGYYSLVGPRKDPFAFMPSTANLQKTDRAVHEYLGMVLASLRGQI